MACLLVDHRGRSEKGVNAFFDWQDWPKLAESVMRWLAPEAGASDPLPAAKADGKALLKQLQGSSIEDELADLGKSGAGTSLDSSGGDAAAPLRELKDKELAQRVAVIDQALAAGGSEMGAALLEQLTTVANLPLGTRLRIFTRLQRERPATAAAQGRAALRSQGSQIQGNGYVLLALAGDPAFARTLASPPAIALDSEAASQQRFRDLSLAITFYPKPDLVEEGKRRVEGWNRQEADARAEFARVCGPDTAMLETSPCLDADATYARLAWLAYLSRHDPGNYATPFVREWLMARQYVDDCWRTTGYLIQERKMNRASVNACWGDLAERFASLQEQTRPEVEAVLAKAPAEAGAVLANARFMPEIQAAINLFGNLDRAASAGVFSTVKQARSADLAAFVAARQKEKR